MIVVDSGDKSDGNTAAGDVAAARQLQTRHVPGNARSSPGEEQKKRARNQETLLTRPAVGYSLDAWPESGGPAGPVR